LTKFGRIFMANEKAEIFSYALIIKEKKVEKTYIGISIANIFKKMIKSELWKMFIEMYSEREYIRIVEIILRTNNTVAEYPKR